MASMTRRELLGRSALATAASLPGFHALASVRTPRTVGPNDKVNVATVGVKGRGRSHISAWLKSKDAHVAAIIDIDESVISSPMKMISKAQGKQPQYYKDLRKAIEDKSIDAISIATCNHTHTLLALWAVQAGKHVYVEKPLSHNVREGRQLLKASRKYDRIVQHGTQSRSSSWRGVIKFLRSGELGKVKTARALCYKRRKSIGTHENSEPPVGVDYNLWLGPAMARPFNRNRFHYNWHWHWDYGNGDIGNQGVHQMDIARWGLGKAGLPKSVISVGGRLGYRDQAETPNTQITLMDYGDCELIFEVRGLETDTYLGQKVGNIFHCENGYVAGHTAFDLNGKKIKSVSGDTWGSHFQNFLEAIKAGKRDDQTADVAEGHPSAALCHLPHISHKFGEARLLTEDEPFGDHELANATYRRTRKHLEDNGVAPGENRITVGPLLKFDPETETFPGDEEASKLLTRAYRKPFVVPEEV